jgi:hypothetical protein
VTSRMQMLGFPGVIAALAAGTDGVSLHGPSLYPDSPTALPDTSDD